MRDLIAITIMALLALVASAARVTMHRKCIRIQLWKLDAFLFAGWYRNQWGRRAGCITLPFASVAWR